MAKKKVTKRAKKYESKLALKEGVEFTDLIGVALQKPKVVPKAKRATVKKK